MLNVSLFLPFESVFYRRLFIFLKTSFEKQGCQVSGQCSLLSNDELSTWLKTYKPDFVFEMNRVKDEISIMHDKKIFHISWIVDFQGRDETQIKGSDITYFFDPGCEFNYQMGGNQDWLPPGTCIDTFYPLKNQIAYQYDFGFIGHIPRPWTTEEMNRPLSDANPAASFGGLLREYEKVLDNAPDEIRTHRDLVNIIDNLASELVGNQLQLPVTIYYDLMERTKRLNNRQAIINHALKFSQNIRIYGSENWQKWEPYKKYYHSFMECPVQLNHFHQNVQYNLHDGLGFHFRAIDCLAAGGLLLHFDNEPKKSHIKRRGLDDYFDSQFHYYEVDSEAFADVYHAEIGKSYPGSLAQRETLEIVRTSHTWDNRIKKIISDFNSIR